MRKFLFGSKNVATSSFVWNMCGSMLMAFQSVLLLMVLTRTVGIVEAGIFTIAYANANLFMNIGKFGMRNFQVSDVMYCYSFQDYLFSRYISAGLMLMVSIGYVIYAASSNNYTLEKSMIILWMCVFKIPDVIEDVYYGEYQRKSRLDVASKSMTIRMLITLALYIYVIVVTKNQLVALIVSTLTTYGLLAYFIIITQSEFVSKSALHLGKTIELMKNCFPLFTGAFLAFYIGNAPKYAIDSQLSDELQACYGFISMPVFVVGLLNSFIFNPMLYKISCQWEEKKYQEFTKSVAYQVLVIIVITVVCMLGAFLIGIPVLSLLYNTNLVEYKKELLVLLLGGGFLGMSGLLNAIITIIRSQSLLVWCYGIVSIVAMLFSNAVVKKYQIMGAAIFYTSLMFFLCVLFFIILAIRINKEFANTD